MANNENDNSAVILFNKIFNLIHHHPDISDRL
jgi:hypothetical protein